jgi:hypothetical protein
VTDEQRSRRPIFNAILRAVASWLFFRVAHSLRIDSDKIVPLAASLFADMELLSKHRAALRRCNGGPHHLFEHVAQYVAAEQKLGRIRRQVDPLGIAVLLLAACFHWVFIRQANNQNLFKMTDTEFVDLTVSTIEHAIKPKAR